MTNTSPQLSVLTATTARRSYTLSCVDRASSGPAMLYVHGRRCSKADFMPMASLPELQTFSLVSADNSGCGDSPYDDNHPLNVDGVVELMESDYSFQTVEYSDHGNLLDRFLSLPAPKRFLYGSQNRHLSYLQRLRESECMVIELPHANHFLFYDQPNHYAAALACQNSCSFPDPGTPISRLASSTFAKGEI